MENNHGVKNFVDRGMEETSDVVQNSAYAVSKPGALLYERIKPLLLEFIGHTIIRPLMSPRRIRYS